MISEIKQGKGLVGSMVNDNEVFDSVKTVVNNLVKTTQNTLEGASSFAENMEALKHNWLFKNYFEERGYWNKMDYERELDFKIQELTKQNAILEQRIEELKKLEKKLDIDKDKNKE
jgi:phospholipid/cholesterol/gamma-HCH transport system substrate-binding protein